jgi:nucleoside-diphosphate-sugar epimerase
MAATLGGGRRRVVVVGATGNVGTSLVESLAADPAVGSVVGLARRAPLWSAPKTQWVAADVAEDNLVEVFRSADSVVHLAWLFQPTHDPATTWRTNVLGSIRVFDAVAEAGVPALVYASSVGAYSPGPKDAGVDERWPTHGWPGAAYTREKAYVERVLDGVEHDHPDIRVVRLRPAFTFKRQSASQQRRLFAGPLVPGRLIRPSTVPIMPDFAGLRFQAVHTADVAEAYRLAALQPVHGAFNVAAEPVVDAQLLADCLNARVLRVPVAPMRAALSALWHLHLVPAAPQLFDAVMRLPLMDTTRARTELGWAPRYDSREAIQEFLAGLGASADMATPPLSSPAEGGRLGEVASGVGQRP